ncbi:membrane dipeptidase [Massilia arenosa]|uniref:Membrane dipeptidase n=1 Tax=Zemynaea arenosa TaxID=2561931 RepID=A0A4Y9SCG1_9BURK|nr:dipeptidase [Massilia arenosa]TFW20231.1 membrane dipeptidase [Massilia arenosa]
MLRYAVLLSAFVLPCAFAAAPDPALVHARTLLKSAILIDGHNDLPWEIREDPKTPMDLEGYDLRGHAPNETDIPRLKQGQVRGQFWSVFVPGELKEGFARTQLEQLDLARRMIARYPEAMELALTAADVRRIAAKGKVASLIGMEGGHVIENSLGALRTYYDLGARYMTLTHNVTLDWADAALGEPRHHGLTPFGKEVVREMNRLGMLADISHVSADVMRQVLDVSAAPVIFSHSSALALVDHPRNVPDDVLRRMQANGGVVMVSFVPPFVNRANRAWHVELDKRVKGAPPGTDPKQIVEEFTRQHGPEPQATLKDVADHIDYVAKVAGHDHIGVAGDYCAGAVPVGLEDVSKYPDLFAELIRRGWSDADLKKLAGDNVLRAMAQAEQVAKRLQKERPPSIATIGALDGKK